MNQQASDMLLLDDRKVRGKSHGKVMSVYCKDDGRGRGLKILGNLEAGGDCYLGLKQGSAACLGTEPVVTSP